MVGGQAKAVGGGSASAAAVPPRDRRSLALISLLLFGNLDDFVPASKAAENPDLALGDAEMLCQ